MKEEFVATVSFIDGNPSPYKDIIDSKKKLSKIDSYPSRVSISRQKPVYCFSIHPNTKINLDFTRKIIGLNRIVEVNENVESRTMKLFFVDHQIVKTTVKYNLTKTQNIFKELNYNINKNKIKEEYEENEEEEEEGEDSDFSEEENIEEEDEEKNWERFLRTPNDLKNNKELLWVDPNRFSGGKGKNNLLRMISFKFKNHEEMSYFSRIIQEARKYLYYTHFCDRLNIPPPHEEKTLNQQDEEELFLNDQNINHHPRNSLPKSRKERLKSIQVNIQTSINDLVEDRFSEWINFVSNPRFERINLKKKAQKSKYFGGISDLSKLISFGVDENLFKERPDLKWYRVSPLDWTSEQRSKFLDRIFVMKHNVNFEPIPSFSSKKVVEKSIRRSRKKLRKDKSIVKLKRYFRKNKKVWDELNSYIQRSGLNKFLSDLRKFMEGTLDTNLSFFKILNLYKNVREGLFFEAERVYDMKNGEIKENCFFNVPYSRVLEKQIQRINNENENNNNLEFDSNTLKRLNEELSNGKLKYLWSVEDNVHNFLSLLVKNQQYHEYLSTIKLKKRRKKAKNKKKNIFNDLMISNFRKLSIDEGMSSFNVKLVISKLCSSNFKRHLLNCRIDIGNISILWDDELNLTEVKFTKDLNNYEEIIVIDCFFPIFKNSRILVPKLRQISEFLVRSNINKKINRKYRAKNDYFMDTEDQGINSLRNLTIDEFLKTNRTEKKRLSMTSLFFCEELLDLIILKQRKNNQVLETFDFSIINHNKWDSLDFGGSIENGNIGFVRNEDMKKKVFFESFSLYPEIVYFVNELIYSESSKKKQYYEEKSKNKINNKNKKLEETEEEDEDDDENNHMFLVIDQNKEFYNELVRKKIIFSYLPKKGEVLKSKEFLIPKKGKRMFWRSEEEKDRDSWSNVFLSHTPKEIKKIVFRKHSDLDLFYRTCKDKIGNFRIRFPSIFNLLVSFDNAFWLRFCKFKENKFDIRKNPDHLKLWRIIKPSETGCPLKDD